MIFLFLSGIIFLITFIIHILLHRFLLRYKIVTFKSLSIFAFGFILDLGGVIYLYENVPINNSEILFTPLPVTALILYVLLSLNFAIFMTSIYLKDQSPSAKLVWLVKINSKAELKEIKHYFSNSELIFKRLADLVRVRWIKKEGARYKIITRGKLIIKFIYFYRSLLGWKITG